MKKHIITLIIAALCVGVMASCDKREPADRNAGKALVILPSVGGQQRAANYSAADYFGMAGYDEVTVTADAVTKTYVYSAGKLEIEDGEDPFYYALDGTPIASLSISWPEASVRGGGPATDQSVKDAFLQSDWLSATLTDIAPVTELYVQLRHENAKIAFLPTNGKRIVSLEINGYKAYCDPARNEAQLILAPGAAPISATDTGTIQIEGEATRSFTINDFPATLAAGENYTINLNVL